MINSEIDCLVVGAGPAGLGAATQAARHGARVLVVDENTRPGGQLFKQIHKFFGSQDHMAGTRGFRIGELLLEQARELGVQVHLDTLAWGIFDDNVVSIRKNNQSYTIAAKTVVIATGATENALSFPGCTRPGVMTAGAAQTMINIHQVLPGKKILMVGTGNVGLIVSYQLMQAGAEVVAIVEAMPDVGGYDVHAKKVQRAGVPFFLQHTIVEARGNPEVTSAVLAPVDNRFQPLMDQAFEVDADTVCLAVGLSPRIDLALLAGCKTDYVPALGGHLPVHSGLLETRENLYVAGDAAGIEEASTALEEGKLAGTAVAMRLGLLSEETGRQELNLIEDRLRNLRSGCFGETRQIAKQDVIVKGCKFYGYK